MTVENNDTLCNNNLLVQSNLRILKYKLKVQKIKDEEIYRLINDSLEVLKRMKKSGQKLEDRCRKYRHSIEALGFQRIKK